MAPLPLEFHLRTQHQLTPPPLHSDQTPPIGEWATFCSGPLANQKKFSFGASNNSATRGGGGQPRRYRVPGQPLLNRHQVGCVSRSPDGLFAQGEREPIRGRPAVRGKRTYGGRPGQRVEEQGTWASRIQKHSEAGYGRPVDRGAWAAKTVKRPQQQPAHPQYANYWAPLTRKRHTMPHSAQPQYTNYWAPRTRKRHQQEHRPQRPTESSAPTQHAKGRTGDCPGPRKGTTTRRNVTQGGGGGWTYSPPPLLWNSVHLPLHPLGGGGQAGPGPVVCRTGAMRRVVRARSARPAPVRGPVKCRAATSQPTTGGHRQRSRHDVAKPQSAGLRMSAFRPGPTELAPNTTLLPASSASASASHGCLLN